MAIDGTYNITMKTPMGDRNAEVTLKEDGGNLTGTMSGDGQTTDISNAKIEDGRYKWDVAVTVPMPITLSFDVDETCNGSVKLGMFGTAPVSATKA